MRRTRKVSEDDMKNWSDCGMRRKKRIRFGSIAC